MRYVWIALLLTGCAGSPYYTGNGPTCYYTEFLGYQCIGSAAELVGPSNIGSFIEPVTLDPRH